MKKSTKKQCKNANTFKIVVLTNEQYIEIAKDYHGAAMRDNSSEELVEIGKQIEHGD